MTPRGCTRRELLRQLSAPALAVPARFAWNIGAVTGLVGQATKTISPPPTEKPIFYDQDGLIVHRTKDGNPDGGDTAQREGWYWVGRWIRDKRLNDPWPVQRRLTFSQVIALLEPKEDGIFYRHPKLAPWNNPFDKDFGFSRDQMTPLVAAMGLWGVDAPLRRLWNALPQDPVGGTKHTFNGSWVTLAGRRIAHTGDIVGPSTINLFRRAWNEDPMRAGDGNGPGGECELLANVGIRFLAAATDRDNTGDDLNLIVMLLMALLRFPSQCNFKCPLPLPEPVMSIPPCTAQAVQRYAKDRPVSYGSFLGEYRAHHGDESQVHEDELRRRLDAGIQSGWTTDASRVYGAVRWYHRAASGANPQLAELYQPIIRTFLE
jgi:hypothetical protein